MILRSLLKRTRTLRTRLANPGFAGLVIGLAALVLGVIQAPKLQPAKPSQPVPPPRSTVADGQLKLDVRMPREVSGENFVLLTGVLRNQGPDPVTLRSPCGDSYDTVDVSPRLLIQGESLHKGGWLKHSLLTGGRDCGNRNAPRPEEFHVLKAGESLEFYAKVQVNRPGTYRIRLTYANDPFCSRFDWLETYPGIQMLRKTPRCLVTSDYCLVTRVKPRKSKRPAANTAAPAVYPPEAPELMFSWELG